jgi:glycosyltransferase involved in cell wall biosynthesis
MTVYAIVPAFNEANVICDLLLELQSFADKTIVVDDGSEDGTLERVQQIKGQSDSLHVIRNNTNLGKSGAVKRGLDYVLTTSRSDDLIVCLDADMSHAPSEIPRLAEHVTEVDMVIGNRYHHRVLDAHREAVVKMARYVAKRFTGYDLSDPICGYRVFGESLGKLFARNLVGKGYSLELEELLLCRKVGARVESKDLDFVVEQKRSTKCKEILDFVEILPEYESILELTVVEKERLLFAREMLRQKKTFVMRERLGGEELTFSFKYMPSEESYALEARTPS